MSSMEKLGADTVDRKRVSDNWTENAFSRSLGFFSSIGKLRAELVFSSFSGPAVGFPFATESKEKK